MDYPIIQVRTKDNFYLHGLYLPAKNKNTIFINFHGTASNFYEEDYTKFFSEEFSKNDISLISANNRGAGVFDAYQQIGAAVEKFEDCLIDFDAWLEFAINEGYQNIILAGHSLGAEKVVYYMNHGQYANKISAIVLLGPADSYGSHRMLKGQTNPRLPEIENLLQESQKMIENGQYKTFLPLDAYGSIRGIMPKNAESFLDFLGPNSKLNETLPFATGRLEAYSKIKIPILAIISDNEDKEFTALPIPAAMDLMKKENPNTETVIIENTNHDFEGKEKELTETVIKFINGKIQPGK
ncbi:MAG: DUF1749 domain-containing protein [bacterium]|nr:DUF1749 domain-containing protein [bacterium]